MKFISHSVPDVTVVSDDKGYELNIKTMQYLDEQEDRVCLKCAEYIPIFKRGFTCNLVCHYETTNRDQKDKEKYSDVIKDLVLVYINKSWDIESIPSFEYVFYK